MQIGGTTSPIESVPNDCLQEIFLHCLPTLSVEVTLSPSQAPILLTHICQRWRRVTLAFPQLWKCMRLDIKRINLDDAKLQTFAAAVARGKSAPRNLQLIIVLRPWIEDKEKTDPLYPIPNIAKKLFVPAAPSLTCLVLNGIPIAQIHSLPNGLFPALASLVLHFEGPDLSKFPWDVKGPLSTFSDAPALRRVGLGLSSRYSGNYVNAAYASRYFVLPWEQLTHILDFGHAEGISPPTFYLRKCRNIRYLYNQLSWEDHGQEGYLNQTNAKPAPLYKLESLTLYFWMCGEGEIGYPAIIDVFDCPNLKVLRLDGAELDFEEFTDELWMGDHLVDRFLSKLSQLHKLTCLSLCLSSINPDTLHAILLATPNVTTLDAQIYENYELFFETLTWDPASTGSLVLPKLETLVLEMDNSVAEDDGEGDTIPPYPFGAFLKSRMEGGTPVAFRTIIAYSSHQKRFDDGVEFVQVALEYVSRGLVLERRLVAEERRYGREVNYLWVARDPDLHDWPELVDCW